MRVKTRRRWRLAQKTAALAAALYSCRHMLGSSLAKAAARSTAPASRRSSGSASSVARQSAAQRHEKASAVSAERHLAARKYQLGGYSCRPGYS